MLRGLRHQDVTIQPLGVRPVSCLMGAEAEVRVAAMGEATGPPRFCARAVLCGLCKASLRQR